MRRFFAAVGMLASLGWGLAQTHQHHAAPAENGRFNPFLVSNGGRGFYLAYIERTSALSNLMLRRAPDGEHFSAPVRVNDRPGDAVVRNENPPKLALGPRGEVYACWASERERWKGNIRFARSIDGGRTFSAAIDLNSDAGGAASGHAFQSLAVDRNGRIYVAWIDERARKSGDRGAEIWLASSDDGGKTFSRDRKILSDVCECCRTTLAIDSAGRLLVSYRTIPPLGPMCRDIVVARSQDGRSFTPTIVSRDGWEVTGCPVAGPALSIDERGDIVAVWFTGGGERPGLYFSVSLDGGMTWSARRLLDPDQRLGKHAQAVAAGRRILIAWDDVGDTKLTAWGLLDPRRGTLDKIAAREGISFPTVAASGRLACVAGIEAAGADVRHTVLRLLRR
jgi:hypothetical protein